MKDIVLCPSNRLDERGRGSGNSTSRIRTSIILIGHVGICGKGSSISLLLLLLLLLGSEPNTPTL